MNALTPGKPKGPRGKGVTPADQEAGVRLTMDFDDDVPLDQLPDGGLDPAAFGERVGEPAGSPSPGHSGRDEGQRASAGDSTVDGSAAAIASRAGLDRPAADDGRAGSDDRLAESATGMADFGGRDPALVERDAGAAPDARHAPGRAARAGGAAASPAGVDWQSADRVSDRGLPENKDDGWLHPEPSPGNRPGTEAPGRAAQQPASVPRRLSAITVTLSVELGRQQVALGDLLATAPGQFFALDRLTSEPVEILVNGQLFARGDVVVLGDQFGVRLTELVDPER